MKYMLPAFVIVFYCFCILQKCSAQCVYPAYKDKTSPPGHSRLSQLIGKRPQIVENEDYKFHFGICSPAMDPPVPQYAGVVQEDKKQKKFHIIGNINQSFIMSGSEWLLLEYRGGENYHSKCGREKRKATIMFVCDKNVVKDPVVRILDENTEKHAECYYLFEINHASICSVPKPPTGFSVITSKLSVGSILILTFLIIITLYLIIGFLIQRSLGAKGFNQIPNYTMWQELGNLIADGCDFVCRSRPKTSNHLYPPMDDRRTRQTLEPDDSRLVGDDGDDDHLLPM